MNIIKAGFAEAFATIQKWYTDENHLLINDISAMRELLPNLESAATHCIEQANADQLKQIMDVSCQDLNKLSGDILKKHVTLAIAARDMLGSTETEKSELNKMRVVIDNVRNATQRLIITPNLASSTDGYSMYKDLLRCLDYLKSFPVEMRPSYQEFLDKAKLLLDSIKLKIVLIAQVQEFYEKEYNLIVSANNFKILLSAIIASQNIRLTTSEKSDLISSIEGIDNLLTTYQELNLAEAFIGTRTPEDLMKPLNIKISSDIFERYAQIISLLCSLESALTNINKNHKDEIENMPEEIYNDMTPDKNEEFHKMKKKFINLGFIQRLTIYFANYKNLIVQIVEKISAQERLKSPSPILSPALTHATSTLSVITQLALDVDTLVGTVEDAIRRAAETAPNSRMLSEDILDIFLSKQFLLSSNSEHLHLSDKDFYTGLDVYLKNTLSRVYPQDFILYGSILHFNLNGRLAGLLDPSPSRFLKALGITNAEKVSFDPRNFDAAELDQLFNIQNQKNPLWLALKSTIPVSDKFTAKEKIETYIALAGQFFKKNIVPKEKYKGALAMAKAAYTVAAAYPLMPQLKQRVEEAFKPQATGVLVSMTEAKVSARNGQYGDWIVAKHIHSAAGEKESVMQTLMGTALCIPTRAGTAEITSETSSRQLSPEVRVVMPTFCDRSPPRLGLLSVRAERISEIKAPDLFSENDFQEPEFTDVKPVLEAKKSEQSNFTFIYGEQTYQITLKNITEKTFPYVFAGSRSSLSSASLFKSMKLSEVQKDKITEICNKVLNDLNLTDSGDQVLSLCFKPNAEKEVDLEVCYKSKDLIVSVVYQINAYDGPDASMSWLSSSSYKI